MTTAQEIADYFRRHREVAERTAATLAPALEVAARQIVAALQRGGKVLVAGNGGSAADAQHFAAELVGRFLAERRALPAISLSTDTSALTAIGNDYGFESIFSRQVEALARPGDVLVAISTSGRSANLLAAVAVARGLGCTTIGLLGRDGGPLADAVELALVVPAEATPHIQEMHITAIHLLCALIDRAFTPPERAAEPLPE